MSYRADLGVLPAGAIVVIIAGGARCRNIDAHDLSGGGGAPRLDA